MSQAIAADILSGIIPMPEDVTVETLFAIAHITPSVPTPF